MNEARAWDQAGRKAEAAEAYLAAARLFSSQEADDDLALALARLGALKAKSAEVKEIRAKALYRAGKKDEAAKLLAELVARGAGTRAAITPSASSSPRGAGARRRSSASRRPSPSSPTFPCTPSATPRGSSSSDAPGNGDPRRDSARHGASAPADGWALNLAGQEALSRGDLALRAACLEAARRPCPAPRSRRSTSPTSSRGRAGPTPPSPRSPPSPRTRLPQPGRQRPGPGRRVRRVAGGGEDARSGRARVLPRRGPRAAIRGVPGESRRGLHGAGALLRGRRADQESPRPRARARGASSWPATSRRSTATSPRRGRLPARPGEPSPRIPASSRPWAAATSRCGTTARPAPPGGRLAEAAPEARGAAPRGDRGGDDRGPLLLGLRENLAGAARPPRPERGERRAMPPDDSPAGACPRCGKVFCIACRKAELADSRFTCPDCGEALKLSDNRLRYLVRESIRRDRAALRGIVFLSWRRYYSSEFPSPSY